MSIHQKMNTTGRLRQEVKRAPTAREKATTYFGLWLPGVRPVWDALIEKVEAAAFERGMLRAARICEDDSFWSNAADIRAEVRARRAKRRRGKG
jgi:hypothetical protein